MDRIKSRKRPFGQEPRSWVDKSYKARKAADTLKGIVAPVLKKNEPGRGPDKIPLKQRRLHKYAGILLAIGLLDSEVHGTTSSASDKNDDIFRPWHEKIPSNLCFGGASENRTAIAQAFLSESDKELALGTHEFGIQQRKKVYLFEHIEKNPIAYGVQGMKGVMVRFGPSKKNGFFNVVLGEGENSPSVYDVNDCPDFYFSKGFGLLPLFECPLDEGEYEDYYVLDGVAYPVKCAFICGQLEPSAVAPTVAEAKKLKEQIVSRPEFVSPAELCMCRATMDFYNKMQASCEAMKWKMDPRLYNFSAVTVLESLSLLAKLYRFSDESDLAMFGKTQVRVAEIQALRFIAEELQQSPWHKTEYFRCFFREVGASRNFFPNGANMRVYGHEYPFLVSYLPGEMTGAGAENCDSWLVGVTGGVQKFEQVSSKKKNDKLETGEKVAISGNADRDLRVIEIEEFRQYVSMAGVTPYYYEEASRWDLSWMLEMICGSHIGPFIYGAEFAERYARSEHAQIKRTATQARQSDIARIRKAEKLPFFQAFRGRAAFSLSLLLEKLGFVAQGKKRQRVYGQEEDEEEESADIDDDFCALLENSIFKEAENKAPLSAGNKKETDEEFAARAESEQEGRVRHRDWLSSHREVCEGVRIQKKTIIYYSLDGKVSLDNLSAIVHYFRGKLLKPDEQEMATEEEEEEEEEEEAKANAGEVEGVTPVEEEESQQQMEEAPEEMVVEEEEEEEVTDETENMATENSRNTPEESPEEVIVEEEDDEELWEGI